MAAAVSLLGELLVPWELVALVLTSLGAMRASGLVRRARER